MKTNIKKPSMKNGCHFLYEDVLNFTVYTISLHYILHRKIIPALYFPFANSIGKILKKETPKKSDNIEGEILNLNVGELVEVRSLEEIYATLDEKRRFKGLFFMREMAQFCGEKLRVYKKVEKIMLESTGEIRKLKSPTVFLVGAHCDGKMHGGCDRSCFLFWREIWLKRPIDKDPLLKD